MSTGITRVRGTARSPCRIGVQWPGTPGSRSGAVPRHTTFRREDDERKIVRWHGDTLASGQNGGVAQQLLSTAAEHWPATAPTRKQGPSAGGLMTPRIDQAADGVWLVTGTDVNWVLVADADEVTLVDTGEPRDLAQVLSSVERIGRAPRDVRAIVLTHAHPDHIGGAERLRADRGIPVRLLAAEAPHARGQVIEEASKLQILRIAWRPQILLWTMRILRAGATRAERLTEVKPFDAGQGPLDVPGRLVPVPAPGHTSGHCAFHLPDRGVLITGDALITAHPAAGTVGPQLCPPMFNHDEAAAVASLHTLAALPADVVLPGHGPAYRGSPASAVERVLAQHT
jgi:glyoxylase-like metal-dependent hydrolase (beta-lactamase superfamily II)